MSQRAAVELRDVCKKFGATEIIRGVNLSIPRGERHAIIGPNGAGKTTLFNLISGRFPISSGSITVNGHRSPIWRRRRSTGWVFRAAFRSPRSFRA
jgi:ABC-type multidrug transport system ATPase subunit